MTVFKKIIAEKKILSPLLLGIGLRLIYGLLFNQMVDYMNILALVKSIADTGNFTYGLIALKRIGFEVQLYGKIYYQIIALWLKFLDWLGVVPIKYIFDTKPLTDPQSYMIGLWQWSPPLYQLTIIKLIQFLWDFLFVFFLYKTAKLLNKNLAWLSILFWALNPYFMMINYAFFMPEIFMLAAFVAGLYFWLKIFEDKKNTFFKILAMFFLTLGAIIKQVPLLLIPFFLIFAIRNWKDLLLYTFTFFFFYIFLKQGWASDGFFINKFFLFSKESLGLLRNNFNNIPYFLYFYGILLFFVFKKRAEFFSKKENIILLTVLIICLVYLNDPVFFIQFVIWIIPFSFLLIIVNEEFLPIFNLTILALLIKGWQNEMYLSPILSPTIGAMYNEHLTNKTIINNFFDYEVYYLFIRFLVNFCYLLALIETVSFLFFKKTFFKFVPLKNFFYISAKKTIFILFIAYVFLNITDFYIKSSYILLSQKKYQIKNEELVLTKKPYVLKVRNPAGKKIKAIQLPIIIKNQTVFDDFLKIDILKEGKVFLSKKISDYTLLRNYEEPLIIFLPKLIKEKEFAVKIYKEKGLNDSFLQKAEVLNDLNKPPNGLFIGYEETPEENLIKVNFNNKDQIFPIYFRGKYDLNDVLTAVKFHTNAKAKKFFFGFYIIISTTLIISSYLLIKNYNAMRDRSR